MTDDPTAQPNSAEDITRELTTIAQLRTLLKQSEGNDFRPPTAVPDRLLDQLNNLIKQDDSEPNT